MLANIDAQKLAAVLAITTHYGLEDLIARRILRSIVEALPDMPCVHTHAAPEELAAYVLFITNRWKSVRKPNKSLTLN